MTERNLFSELGDLPDLLGQQSFKRAILFKTNTLQLWSCMIDYGQGTIESFGVNPESAIENVLDMLKRYIADGMPNMSRTQKIEKYSPDAYQLAKDRWESI